MSSSKKTHFKVRSPLTVSTDRVDAVRRSIVDVSANKVLGWTRFNDFNHRIVIKQNRLLPATKLWKTTGSSQGIASDIALLLSDNARHALVIATMASMDILLHLRNSGLHFSTSAVINNVISPFATPAQLESCGSSVPSRRSRHTPCPTCSCQPAELIHRRH